MNHSNDIDQNTRGLLSVLEAEEARLLSWGVTSGGFTEAELIDRANTYLAERDLLGDPEEILRAMLDRGLLLSFNVRGTELYRTRMAESVRLFAGLRQIFDERQWRFAPTLVSDYRFSIAPRIYPRQHIGPTAVLERLCAERQLSAIEQAALSALLESPGRALALADFQFNATASALRGLAGRHDRGMIVCASTGTGKTLSFYLPALTHVAGLVATDATPWVKALAIYPRKELLADQFSETYRETRRLDGVLTARDRRKITIGAYYGPTPREATAAAVKAKNWSYQSAGYVCPYLRCPSRGCEGELIWRHADLEAGQEQLHCARTSCGAVITSDEVVLTRSRMAKIPPDLVFTTTEMLNRSMSDFEVGHVFGLRTERPPHLMLLDEVHTYTGVPGAQVALLLRRWRKAIAGKVHFTGLSATLRNAQEFFANLTGLPVGAVDAIGQGTDLETDGMEYKLALRGDPISGTSLLSTTIQTAMLLRRVLDPKGAPLSGGTYGERVFVFTDDLDVTNRLFHNLLDAEGRDSWGRPAQAQPLAATRSHNTPDAAEKFDQAQSWYLAEQLGHSLGERLEVTRTSSQDAGVARGSDLIVATASLEVGFNDPGVGAVIQHKAPRDMGSFLQRKGRAGRRRGMRPWTLVVLSDFGRDRIAFQGYDLLFEPLLEERTLPVRNRYVLRIQATYAFMDWVAKQLNKETRGSVWRDFTQPATYPAQRARQVQEAAIVRQVMFDPAVRQKLAGYLKAALDVSADEVQALLWEPPRALLTAVLPTLLRRLETEWRRVPAAPGETEQDVRADHRPLPDFLPSTLFNDLLLPEVAVVTPPQTRQSSETVSHLPIVQALSTLAPGRVTRRFAVEHRHVSHWIQPASFESGAQDLPLSEMVAEFAEIGHLAIRQVDGSVRLLRTVQPQVIRVVEVPKEVAVTSNAFLSWASQLVPCGSGTPLELPDGSPWRRFMVGVAAYLQQQRDHIEVRRAAYASEADIRVEEGRRKRDVDAHIRFVGDGGAPIGLGFSHQVDGLVFRFRIPEGYGIRPDDPNRRKIWAFRTAYFRHRVLTDPRLEGLANHFQRDLLQQVYLSGLTACALENGTSLQVAHEGWRLADFAAAMGQVLDAIFQVLGGDDDDGSPLVRQRNHQRLLALCHVPEVQVVLHELATTLWMAPDHDWDRWAVERFKATLGGALLEGCRLVSPQVDIGDLIVDLDGGPRPPDAEPMPEGVAEIWISETMAGGGGLIEDVARRYASDPVHFFRLVESALEASEHELVDSELTRVLDLVRLHPTIAGALEAVRVAEGHAALADAVASMHRQLGDAGVLVSHSVAAVLSARVLRPGSSAATDAAIAWLMETWRQAEAELGIEIDARVLAYVLRDEVRIDQALEHLDLTETDASWRFKAIYSLLWPRGSAVRARTLTSYNPFAALPEADRHVVLDVLHRGETQIPLGSPDWRRQVEDALLRNGEVTLIAPSDDAPRLREALMSLVAQPLDVGFLHVYPQVDGVTRVGGTCAVKLRIQEAVQ